MTTTNEPADLLELCASGEAHARNTDPDTSHAAAASVTRDTRTETQRALVRLLRRYGPMTDAELAERYYLATKGQPACSPSGLRTRRSELVRDGFVVDTGKRRTLNSGRKAIVWGLA